MLLPGWCGNPPQYSGGSSWLEGVGASLEPAAAPRTRLSTEIGHDTNLSLLRNLFLNAIVFDNMLVFEKFEKDTIMKI